MTRTDRTLPDPNWIKIELPIEVYQHIEELAQSQGEAMETLVAEAAVKFYEESAPSAVLADYYPSGAELEMAYRAASTDPDRLELSRDWDSTSGDGLSDH